MIDFNFNYYLISSETGRASSSRASTILWIKFFKKTFSTICNVYDIHVTNLPNMKDTKLGEFWFPILKEMLRKPTYFLRRLRNFSRAHSHPHTINRPPDYPTYSVSRETRIHSFPTSTPALRGSLFFRHQQSSWSPKSQPSGSWAATRLSFWCSTRSLAGKSADLAYNFISPIVT